MEKEERDAQLKAFFSSTNGDASDDFDYTNNPEGRFLNVKNFLTNQRIENESRVEENKDFQKRRDTSMVYDRDVTIGGRVADKKARNSIRMMGDEADLCRQTID